MKEKVRFWGLDVHAETIAIAIAEPDGEVRSLGVIANRAATGCGLASGLPCASGKRAYRKKSRRSPGRRNNDCTSAP
jgi:hypothetical protein